MKRIKPRYILATEVPYDGPWRYRGTFPTRVAAKMEAARLIDLHIAGRGVGNDYLDSTSYFNLYIYDGHALTSIATCGRDYDVWKWSDM